MASGSSEPVLTGWGTPETITFPFTASKDGMVVGYVAAQSNAASYVFINEDGSSYARSSSYGGSGYGICFPARAGCAYTIALSSNIGSSSFKFVPFK